MAMTEDERAFHDFIHNLEISTTTPASGLEGTLQKIIDVTSLLSGWRELLDNWSPMPDRTCSMEFLDMNLGLYNRVHGHIIDMAKDVQSMSPADRANIGEKAVQLAKSVDSFRIVLSLWMLTSLSALEEKGDVDAKTLWDFRDSKRRLLDRLESLADILENLA